MRLLCFAYRRLVYDNYSEQQKETSQKDFSGIDK